jgi:hypothetical protein
MPLGARRTFRYAFVVALSLACAYAFEMRLAFLAPLLAVLLAAPPSPPAKLKGVLALLIVAFIATGLGLVLLPVLRQYPVTAVLIIAAGLSLSTVITVGRGQALIGALLTMGLALIPAAGLIESLLAGAAIRALLAGIALTVICQWIVYPLFPEDTGSVPAPAPQAAAGDVRWIALRTTLIVLPPLLVTFANPSLYLPTIMKTVLLAQQGTLVNARDAGRELLGSTLLAGWFAILFWFALKTWPSLWMFFLLTLLFGIYLGSKLYAVSATRFAASFWTNVGVTMLILLGPALQDSAVGNDVYKAFAVRFSLFVAVTLYAWLAIVILETLRTRGDPRSRIARPAAAAH